MFDQTAVPRLTGLPSEPYKGLAFFRSADRPLFSGRDKEMEICVGFLADSRTRALILQGQTGSGKSSFLRAGLIPTLERQAFGYHFLREYENEQDLQGSVKFIRCGADPVGRIAEALFVYSRRDVSIMTSQGRVSLGLSALRLGCSTIQQFVTLCRSPGHLLSSLRLLARELPVTLLIVIDQAEEVIALGDVTNNYRTQFFSFVHEFMACNFPVKFLIAIRKDYSGEFVELAQIGRSISVQGTASGDTRDPLVVSDLKMFTLAPLRKLEVARAIRLPTRRSIAGSSESPREKYAFFFAPGVTALILRDLFNVSSSVLPAMQLVCRDLYQRAPLGNGEQLKLIDEDLYHAGRRVSGPVDRHISSSLRISFAGKIRTRLALRREEVRARRLLYTLVRREADNSVHSTQITLAEMRSRAEALNLSVPLDEMLEYLTRDDVLLLRTSSILSADRPDERKIYSLGHDFIGGVLHDWHQKREAVWQVWRQIGIAGGIAILALAGVIGGRWLAKSEVRTGMLRGEYTDLVSMAEIKVRDEPSVPLHITGPLVALNIAGQVMTINSDLSQLPFDSSSDQRAANLVARIASGLPRKYVNLIGPPGSFNAPLPSNSGFIHVDVANATVFSSSGKILWPYPISKYTTPNRPVEGYELGEAPDGDVLLLESLQPRDGGTTPVEQLLVLEPSRKIDGPYDISEFEKLESQRKGSTGMRFSGFVGMSLNGDTVALFNLLTKSVVTFAFDGARDRVPFALSRILPISSSFANDHAVTYVDRTGRSLGNVQVLSSAGSVTLLSYDLRTPNSDGIKIPLDRVDAFKGCHSDSISARPCDWLVVPTDPSNSLLLYGALSAQAERATYTNSPIGPRAQDLKRLLVIDVANGKHVSVDISELRDQCLGLSLAASGGSLDSSQWPEGTIISGGTIESLLLGFVSGSSVSLVRISMTARGHKLSCIGPIYTGQEMSRWAISHNGETILATGTSSGAVWEQPERVANTYTAIAKRGPAQIMQYACRQGLARNELRGADWVRAVDLGIPTRELCAHVGATR